MKDPKYIMFSVQGIPTPVIVPNYVSHADVKLGDATPINAGFVSIDCKRKLAKPYGESTSLKLRPSPEDDYFLTKLLFPESRFV